MEVVILNENGDSVGNLEVVDEIFKSEVNNNLLYEAIKNELANRRQGTHSTNYSYRLPKKMKRKALLSVLSLKYGNNVLKVFEDFTFDAPKTKRMASFISKVKEPNSRKVAFVVGKDESLGDNYNKLLLSLRNIKDLKLVNADSMSIHPLYYADEVYFTKTALSKLNARIKG